LVLQLAALQAGAQTGGPIVTGVVKDTAGIPIAGAEVFVGRAEKPAVTNEAGRFRVVSPYTGPQWIAVRKIGYSPTRRSVRLAKAETQVVDLVMAVLPVHLPELKVVEESGFRRTRLQDFWRRSHSAHGGYFITGEDLERRNPINLAHVVRLYLPYASLESWERNPMDYGPMVNRYSLAGTSTVRRCAPAVSYNGSMPDDFYSVSDIPVESVEAVEVYKPRWMQIPTEFQMYGRALQCGLVIVWTK
jgi:hypothetical protein